MRRLRFRSIRSRIALVILACTALSLGVAFATVIVSDVRQFRGDMVENTLLVARVVGDYSVSDLAFGDRTESARTLSTLGSIPSVLSARLYDTSGHLFSSWARPGAGEPRAETPSGTFEKGVLHVEQPIVYNGESYGSIALEASTADLDRKVRRYLALMLSLMLGLIVLAGAAAVKLQALISEPILALAATARQVSEDHDYSVRMARTGDDEIGTLCDGFNDMLAQIERRQHERDLADQRTREKSQFLANMSHELRTPLNSILGFSEILLERLPDRVSAREMKFLQNINNSGQHLLGIINDILDLSKVEAGRMEVHPERVSLTNVVDSVVNVMKGVSAKRRVGFDIDIAEDVPFIEADAVKMKQVLYNLASNAVKFSPEGGTVAIRVGCLAAEASPLGKASVQMAVTDQGPGIDAIDQDLVFQEFRQAKDGARQVEGTGLGLALVKRFVELHDGLVRLTSSPGVGSTFTVVLPVFFRGADQPVASPSSPGESSGPAVRVLVVEDDAGAYKRLAQDLAAARYVPIWARTAEEAVGLARGLRPQAIVLDVLLRGVDGFDVLRQLKTDPGTRQVPLILVSVLENQELGMVLGAADCFVKPLDQESVVRRLRSLVPPGEDDNRLLLIDDDPSVHESLDSWLGAVGYTVDHALTGEQGLARAAECPPALVLLDLAMEPMDGFEAALRLKDDPRTRHAPIVMLSSRDVDGDERLRLRGRLASRLHGSPGALTSVLQAMLARSQ